MSVVSILTHWPKPIRRGVLLIATLSVLVLIYSGLYLPLKMVVSSQAQWRAATQAQIARDKAWAQLAQAASLQLQEIHGSELRHKLYEGVSAAELGGVLQNQINELLGAAGRSGGAVLEPQTPKSWGSLVQVAVRVTVTESADQLKATLLAIRLHEPYLRVTRLHVSAPQSQSSTENALLNVSFDVCGYLGGGSGPGPSKGVPT